MGGLRKTPMEPDASSDLPAEMAVLSAFQAALENNLSIVESYRAGIAVWHQLHPEHVSTYASKQAVRIILKARIGRMNAAG